MSTFNKQGFSQHMTNLKSSQSKPRPSDDEMSNELHGQSTRSNAEQEGMVIDADTMRPVGENEAGPTQPPRRTGSTIEQDEELELTELSAPAPVQEDDSSGQWYKTQHLESRQSDAANVDPDGSPSDRQFSDRATLLYTVSYLIFFSFMGTLARLGVQWLTFYPGAPVVFSNLWANFVGTMVMGFLSEDLKLFKDEWGPRKQSPSDEETEIQHSSEADRQRSKKDHAKVKKTIPLYIGLATGFCGSFTSFSTFLRDVFFTLSNHLPAPIDHSYARQSPIRLSSSTTARNGGYNVMAILAVILITVGMSLGALILGAHLALAVERFTPVLPFRIIRSFVDRLFVPLAFGCWLGAAFMAIWPPDRPGASASRGSWDNEAWRGEVVFALVFAPLGCLLRWYTSLKLNGIVAWFPLGTFSVNVFGCAVEAMCYDFQHVSLTSSALMSVGGGRVGCQVLQGVMDGFCGCLTTVSTWAAELNSLQRRHAYFYGTASIAAGLAVMVMIMGSVLWTIGWQQPVCITYIS